MEQIQLTVKVREGFGKSAVRKLRSQGDIPAIVYGQGNSPLALEIPSKEFSRRVQTAHGNVLLNLQIHNHSKKMTKSVLIKETQYHPVSGELLHVDFYEVSLTQEIKVSVPVVAKGEPVGVKMDGGVLDHSLWELEVSCLATQIPEKVEVDVTNLKIGDAVHVKDVKVPAGVKILNDPQTAVFAVKHPSIEEVAPAEEEVKEPEVLREKKVEEPAEGETPAKAEAPKETKAEKAQGETKK